MTEEERLLQQTCSQDEPRRKPRGKALRFLWLILIATGFYLLVDRVGLGDLINIFIAALGFGLVVYIHEFGHFIFAKMTKMKVEAFSFGFPPTFIGLLRTENGWRIRILPSLIRKGKVQNTVDEDSDEQEPDGRLTFNIGRPQKPGETEYRVGLIPFGGYVKIFGQEDIGKVKSSDDSRSYANRPVWMRMAVIAAGVFFNALLSIALFIIVFHIGIKRVPPLVGGVRPGSPAQMAGLRAGDEIVEIKGNSYNLELADIQMVAALSGRNEKIAVKVRHEDGSVEEFEMVAREEEMAMGKLKLFGIKEPQTLIINRALTGDSAKIFYKETGLMPGDRIIAVDGIEVKSHWEFEEIINNTFEPAVTLTVERVLTQTDAGGDIKERVELIETEVAIYVTSPFVPRLVAEKIIRDLNDDEKQNWLQEGDIILAVADVENPTFKQLREVTEKYKNKVLDIKVLRADSKGAERVVSLKVKPELEAQSGNIVIGFSCGYDFEHSVVAEKAEYEELKDSIGKIPQGATIVTVNGEPVSNYYDIARQVSENTAESVKIGWELDGENRGEVVVESRLLDKAGSVRPTLAGYIVFEPLERLYKATGPVGPIVMGYNRTLRYIKQAYLTIKRLIQGQVSAENLMGPVGIAAFSYEIVRSRPLIDYVFFIGLISAFIGFLNFLPLLPLDGGHIIFLVIEKIKGSPVSERIQLSFAAAGWLFFIGLALYVTFNDLQRIIKLFS